MSRIWLGGPRAAHFPWQPHLSLFVTCHLDLPTAVDIHIQGDHCNRREGHQLPGPAGWSLKAVANPQGCPRPVSGPSSLWGTLPSQQKFVPQRQTVSCEQAWRGPSAHVSPPTSWEFIKQVPYGHDAILCLLASTQVVLTWKGPPP